MVFKTTGNKSNPVILFFHAMGVTGESSMPVAEKMAEKYSSVLTIFMCAIFLTCVFGHRGVSMASQDDFRRFRGFSLS